MKKVLLLGSGELGKELVISLKRLGVYVVAVDKYERAPAMQVADEFEVINMLDAKSLERIVKKHQPDFIIPEIEAIKTEKLLEFEKEGIIVIPSAKAVHLTMNRDAIRDLASKKLKLKTPKYAYANNPDQLLSLSKEIGFPCVIKPVMYSSGKGQSVAKKESDILKSWDFALQGMRGSTQKVIIEEFIPFESEITLLTIKQKNAKTVFVKPIGHRQERGDYQESWLPAKLSDSKLKKAEKMALKITNELGGFGLFGVEFFITKKEVYFSELSPRPHDTGMVTMISQNFSEFDLHARAVLGLPIPEIKYFGPSASAVILSDRESRSFEITNVDKALARKGTDLRLFGKEEARPFRRMGVALSISKNIKEARKKAIQVTETIKIKYSKN